METRHRPQRHRQRRIGADVKFQRHLVGRLVPFHLRRHAARLAEGVAVEIESARLHAIPAIGQVGGKLKTLGQIRLAEVPVDVFFFATVVFLAFLFLRFTKWGRYVYLMGDNFLAARNMGIPVRPMTVLRYVVSALIAFSAGVLTASSLHSINVRVVNSNLLYDVILVVVIGGIGLSGGKGAMRNVVVGALLIGIMQNAMTILDISNIYQNLIKSIILLVAIVVDSVLNPRDEQTAQQGDI